MAVHYRTQGLVIKKINRGESDQFLTIFTKDYGKLEILGKAIRKITSKLRGGAELFYLSEIEFIRGKTHKTLTDAILIDKFSSIRKDLGRLQAAYKICRVLNDLVVKEEEDEKIWQLLNEILEKLNNTKFKINNLQLAYYYFFWNLVSILGYQPELRNFSIHGKKINCDIAKILKVIFRKDWQILSRLKLEPIHLKLLKNISEWYMIKTHEE